MRRWGGREQGAPLISLWRDTSAHQVGISLRLSLVSVAREPRWGGGGGGGTPPQGYNSVLR